MRYLTVGEATSSPRRVTVLALGARRYPAAGEPAAG